MSEDDLSFQICKTPDDLESNEDSREAVLEGIRSFNEKKTRIVGRGISVFMRNREDKVVGGVLGYAFGDLLHVGVLWVEESLRKKGYGTKLLKMIENEAFKYGCKHVDLDTFSFQAKPFPSQTGLLLFRPMVQSRWFP